MENCYRALREISSIAEATVIGRSALYRTEPVGCEEQGWFVNCVVEVRTQLSARELIGRLQQVEKKMGRTESGVKWGPRIIDLDILLFGQEIINEPDLTVPHPQMHKRRFVLEPINEIASYVVHPVFGITMKGLLDRLEDNSAVIRLEP